MASLTQVQVMYLEALKDGPQKSSDMMKIVRDRLSALKSGTTPVGTTARAQGVMQELEAEGYITQVKAGLLSSLLGGKTYELAAKGKEAIAAAAAAAK